MFVSSLMHLHTFTYTKPSEKCTFEHGGSSNSVKCVISYLAQAVYGKADEFMVTTMVTRVFVTIKYT